LLPLGQGFQIIEIGIAQGHVNLTGLRQEAGTVLEDEPLVRPDRGSALFEVTILKNDWVKS